MKLAQWKNKVQTIILIKFLVCLKQQYQTKQKATLTKSSFPQFLKKKTLKGQDSKQQIVGFPHKKISRYIWICYLNLNNKTLEDVDLEMNEIWKLKDLP